MGIDHVVALVVVVVVVVVVYLLVALLFPERLSMSAASWLQLGLLVSLVLAATPLLGSYMEVNLALERRG